MANTPHNKSVLTVPVKDRHHGVTKRAAAPNEPGFVVYRGEVNSEVVAMFFDQEDADEYAKFKNRNEKD